MVPVAVPVPGATTESEAVKLTVCANVDVGTSEASVIDVLDLRTANVVLGELLVWLVLQRYKGSSLTGY